MPYKINLGSSCIHIVSLPELFYTDPLFQDNLLHMELSSISSQRLQQIRPAYSEH